MPRSLPSLFLGALFLMVGSSGCAESIAQWRDVHCNYDAAYAAGLNTYQQGQPLDVASYGQCPAADRPTALRGYREGYEAAMNANARRRGPRAAVVIAPYDHRYGR
jgi:hypothetical protein